MFTNNRTNEHIAKPVMRDMRSTVVSGGFYRKRHGKGRFGFVAIVYVLVFAVTLGQVVNESNENSEVIENVGSRGNFWKAFSDVGEDLDSLPDYFQTSETSKPNIDRLVTAALIERENDYVTGNVDRNKLYRPKDLSDGQWGNHRGMVEEGRRLRNLQNDLIETLEETGLQVDVNATTMEEDLVVEFSRVIVVVTMLLGAIAILLSIISWIFVYLYRNNVLVAIGQPPFLYLICFGSLLLSSELIFLFRYRFADQALRDATCVAQLWFRNIGSVCVHMAIFCKLWRAYKVAQFRKNQIVLPKHVIGPFIVMMLAVIAVTITQTIVCPPVWQIYNDPTLNNVGMCLPATLDMSSISGKGLWAEITMTSIQLLSLIIMLVMAYITRNIPQDISDSWRVFQAVIFGILLTLFSYLLFWIGVWVDYFELSAIARSLRYFFDAINLLGFLVLPKIYGVWREKGDRRNTTNGTRATSSEVTTITSRGKGQVHVTGLDRSV